MRLISIGPVSDRQRPGYTEARIEGIERAFCVRMICSRVQIEELAVVRERLEAVGEAFGDHQGSMIRSTQMFGVPAQETRRVSPDIDRDIEDLAL